MMEVSKRTFHDPLPPQHELVNVMDRSNADQRHKIGPEGFVKLMQTDIANGLTQEEVKRRFVLYGSNYVPRREPDTFWEVLWNNTNDLVVWLIFAAGLLALAVNAADGEDLWYVEGSSTIFTICMVILISSGFEYLRERQFARLLQKTDDFKVVAVRSGELTTITAQSVVVGDVIYLETGDVPPGDGILVSGGALDLDESSLSGESDNVEKRTDEDNAIYGGTNIAAGSGRMVVLCTGEFSIVGQISKSLTDDEAEKSGLEARLEEMAELIGYTSLTCAAVFFVFVVIEFLILASTGLMDVEYSDYMDHIFELFVCALLLLILGIPEGLPVAISLTLVLGAKKMEAENVLVKKPKKGEVMGTVTTICTDKTGTLTTGIMTVKSLVFADMEYTDLRVLERKLPPSVYEHTGLGLALNSTSRVNTLKYPLGKNEESGNTTERALLRILEEYFGLDFNTVRSQYPAVWRAQFSSSRKCSSIAIKMGDKRYLYNKGAPEIVLGLCERYVERDGKVVELTKSKKKQFLTMASEKAMRGIAIAFREIPAADNLEQFPRAIGLKAGQPEGSPESDLTLLGFAFIQDPVREDVPKALRDCKGAGVNVIMVTGDSKATAVAVAKECGLLPLNPPTDSILEGPRFRKMVSKTTDSDKPEDADDAFDQMAFDQIWPTLHVLARSSPIDKYLLVKGLMGSQLHESGRQDIHNDRQVVAVTGDGVNDIAAMNKANVGVAMGGGQQAAIEVAEVVLTDDNFSSCITGIKWGRNIRDAACKFIQFQICITGVFVMFLIVQVVLFMNTLPLTLLQSLWLNLVQDTLGALALASDSASETLLKRKPINEDEPLVGTIMKRNIITQSIYQTTSLIVVTSMATKIFDDPYEDEEAFHRTIAFSMMVLQTLANQFCMRKIEGEYNFFGGVLGNFWFILISTFEFCLQLVIVNHGGSVFGVEELSYLSWGKLISISFCGVWSWYLLVNAVWWYYTTGSFRGPSTTNLDSTSRPSGDAALQPFSSAYGSTQEVYV